MDNKVSLNIEEAKEFLSHIITNNRYLQESGKMPTSVEIVGESGIGKTSMILQLANELGLKMVKINLAQIEELGDLVGFPIRQFELSKYIDDSLKEDKLWVDENMVESYVSQGYQPTNHNRMSYCAPEWISDVETGGVLLLDDWNRADPRFIQALMELIDRQQYISWKLPQDWHIFLTSNPDNGTYSVNSLDSAQKTRFISVDLKFDIDCWAKWAEKARLDGRCINFLIMNPELITTEVNSRSVSMFFNSIISLPSFEANLALIQMCGEGSVGPEFSSMFTSFINNRLDKIIGPREIMTHESADYIFKTLRNLVGKQGNTYRGDIASVIATRLINYSLLIASNDEVTPEYIERLMDIMMDEEIFTADIKFNMVKTIYYGDQIKFKALPANKKLIKYIMS